VIEMDGLGIPEALTSPALRRQRIPTVVSPEAAALDQAYQEARRLGPMPVPHVDRDPAVEVWELIMKGLL